MSSINMLFVFSDNMLLSIKIIEVPFFNSASISLNKSLAKASLLPIEKLSQIITELNRGLNLYDKYFITSRNTISTSLM